MAGQHRCGSASVIEKVAPATGIILAAGAGRRLGELGNRHSKAMLPVRGHPLIHWVLQSLYGAGIDHLVVVGHPKDEALAEFVDTVRPPVSLVFQSERRGMADALRAAFPIITGEPGWLVSACDSVFMKLELHRLLEVAAIHPECAVIGTLNMGIEATATRSAVILEGDQVVRIVEKPPPGSVGTDLVAAPVYWLPATLLPYCSTPPGSGEFQITDALQRFILASGRVLAVRFSTRLEITYGNDVTPAEAWLDTHMPE